MREPEILQARMKTWSGPFDHLPLLHTKRKSQEEDFTSACNFNAKGLQGLQNCGLPESVRAEGKNPSRKPEGCGRGRNGMPRSPGAAIPGHYGSHRPLKSRAQAGTATSPGLDRAHSLARRPIVLACAHLASAPAAGHLVQMRPAGCSRVGNAARISRSWARGSGSQQRFAGFAPRLARAIRPAPPARGAPPPARLPPSKPAAPAGNTSSGALPTGERAAEPPGAAQPLSAGRRRTQPAPYARDGLGRGAAPHAGDCSPRAVRPRQAGRRQAGSSWTPTPPNPWAPGRGGGHPHPDCTTGEDSGNPRPDTGKEFGKGPAPHLEGR
ncbi:unnamed protein product [Rangifer tarandus platyrhynchus]|uniref:Uncharacterized protein n=2 Tax=Rangifer tarandus platyrhynchus TaxID=3082113 RepID=A0ABN8ZN01_RANTA|nr:unnamed protein product [Rangifer tarandus platyrhynchus]CAI9706913.1 unnamed protein product [Rangifer tarandus platyrhynchus]